MDILLIGLVFGLFVGLISSFLGLGGGILIVPLLPIFIPSLSVREVIATSLCAVFLVVSLNTFRFAKKKLVVFDYAVPLGFFSGITAYIAARMTAYVSEELLRVVLVVMLLLVSFRTLLQKRNSGQKKGFFSKIKISKWLMAGSIGSLTGLVSGFTGLGGGVVMSPLLLSFGKLKGKEISPTTNGAMVLTSSLGALGYVGQGSLNWPTWGEIHLDVAFGIVLGAYVTGSLGLKYQEKLSSQMRRFILGSLLLGLTMKVLWTVL